MKNIWMSGNILCQYKGKLIIQQRSKVYLYEISTGRKIQLFDVPWYKRWGARSRLIERLMRLNIREGKCFCGKFVFSQKGCIYTYDFSTGKLKINLEHKKGMRAPLKYTVLNNLNGFEKQICFGEYFTDKEKREVRIVRSTDGEKWETAYIFSKGLIRHIHGIYADFYKNQVYILTGDTDEESAIWIAKDNFKTVECLAKGKQCFRACQMWVRDDCLIWASDSEYEQNYLYRMNKEKGSEVIKIKKLPGSVIYGDSDENSFVFSTTVEPDKGGIKEKKSILYKVNERYQIEELCEFDKDIWSMKYFQYGYVNPILYNGNIYLSGNGIKKYDGKIIVVEKEGLYRE